MLGHRTSRRDQTTPVPVSVEVGAEAVTVTIRGRDRWLALSRGVTVPFERMVRVAVLDRAEAQRSVSRRRKAGSWIHGRLLAGRYGLPGQEQFWFVRRALRVLVIDLEGHKLARVVLEVDDPGAMAAKIEAARRS